MGGDGSLCVQGDAKGYRHTYNALALHMDHLSTKYLRALQLGQVDRLLHLVLVAVSLVGGTPCNVAHFY